MSSTETIGGKSIGSRIIKGSVNIVRYMTSVWNKKEYSKPLLIKFNFYKALRLALPLKNLPQIVCPSLLKPFHNL